MKYDLLMMNVARGTQSLAPHFKECLGQHSIATYLEKYNFQAQVFSGDVTQCKRVLLHEIEQCGVGIVGFYAAADNRIIVENVIRWLKQNTSVITILGGPESYAVDSSFFTSTGCDFVIVGEGEQPMQKLLSYLIDRAGNLEEIESLKYKLEDGTMHTSPLGIPIQNLDCLAPPNPKNSLHKRFRAGRAIGVLTGRGCPFRCGFCFEGSTTKNVRYRSVAHVMEEIDDVLLRNNHLNHISIYDDTYNGPQKWDHI